jgi:tetratricopeptide (TPR) repeat protein
LHIAARGRHREQSFPIVVQVLTKEMRSSRSTPRIAKFLCTLIVVLFPICVEGAQEAAAPPEKLTIAKAEELLRQGKVNESLTILNQLAASDPDTPGIEAELGKAYFQSRQFPQAIAHLKTALRQKPSELEPTQLLALSYFASGDCSQALPILEKLGSQLPKDSADGAYVLASCYIATQRWDEARKTFASMFSVAQDSAMAYLMFGKFLVRQRLEDRAVPEIQMALQRDPHLAMAHFLLAEIDLHNGHVPAAVEELQKELAVNPTVWLVYWRLGDAYVRLEKYDEAEKVLKEAIWLNEASSGAYILLGQIALKRDDPGLAAGFFERALKLDPQNDYVHYFLAKAYQGLGRTGEANQHFEIAKSLRNDKRTDERATLSPEP